MTRREQTRKIQRRQKIKCNVISAGLGCILAIPLCVGHINSAKKYEAERAEQIKAQIQIDQQIEMERQAARDEEMALYIAVSDYQNRIEEADFYVDPDIPFYVQEAAHKAGDKYGISAEFLEAIAWSESRYDVDAVSSDGSCIGLMQISPKWHTDRAAKLGYDTDQLLEAEPSMMVAADYLLELFYRHDDPHWVLMTYNGSSKASAYLKGDAPASNYAEEVLAKYRELEELHREGGGAIWQK